jgi:hypothetical protein
MAVRKPIYVLIGWLMLMVLGVISVFTYLVATNKVSADLGMTAATSFIASLVTVFTTIYLALKNKL